MSGKPRMGLNSYRAALIGFPRVSGATLGQHSRTQPPSMHPHSRQKRDIRVRERRDEIDRRTLSLSHDCLFTHNRRQNVLLAP
jgi:hypothetical protein